jgi:hypothetical protein
MRYYYFNPFSKQYYFPVGFQNYPIFATFYQPYKITAKMMWKMWRTSSLFRKIFSTNEPEKYLPLEHIRQYVTPCSILSFNLGTVGVEQKISVLGVERTTNEAFYIKYATSEIACRNVFNEGVVLQQLLHLSFVAKLQLNINLEEEFTLIKTTVLHGDKMKYQPVNEQLLSILYTLADQKVMSWRNYLTDLQSCFAHGDFCPWNMLVNQGEIEIFDWELAGQYPLGYDLFMYIFQYEFLVNETMNFELLLNENSNVIQQYFKHFEIKEWIPYVQEFSKLRYQIESDKNNSDLIESYLQLKEYVSKL